MGGFGEFLKSLGASRLAAMGAVAIGLIGFFAFVVMRFNEVAQVPLYAGLSLDDAAQVTGVANLAGLAIGIAASFLVDNWR